MVFHQRGGTTVPSKKARVQVPGSSRDAMPGAQLIGDVQSDERVEVTVRVRPRPSTAAPAALALSSQSIAERSYLTRAELRTTLGADPADIAAVRSFAAEQGLEVIEADPSQRKVVLAGPAQKVSAAFGVTLQRYQYAQGTYRGRTGPVTIPTELGAIVEGVFGLDDRPQAKPHFRSLPIETKPAGSTPGATSS